MPTIQVFWKDKFNGRAVTIEEADFDPAAHRRIEDGAWDAAAKPASVERVEEVAIEDVATEESPSETKLKRGRK